jgi:modification methylase
MITSRSTSHTRAVAHRTTARRRLRGPSPMSDLPLALWPCAQQTSQSQRRGRFLPESNRHPAKMLPEIARRVVAAYSSPGDLVLDPMCGIGTTLTEAIHLDRRAIGVELEERWASLAAQNVKQARTHGATGRARVVEGDARRLGRGVLNSLAGTVPLILTSPPYADAMLGDPRGGAGMARGCAGEGRRVSDAQQAYAAKVAHHCHYGDSPGSIARLRYGTTTEAPTPCAGNGESYLSAMTAVYSACARMLAPGGYLVLVTKNMRAGGTMRNIAGDTITLCEQIGLAFDQHIVALLAVVRDGELYPRPSYYQMTNVRRALKRGERAHLVCHEDVLVFKASQATGRRPK